MGCLELLKQRGYKLEVDTLLCQDCPPELFTGIQVLAICNDGSGRSLNVAKALVDMYDIPAAYVAGGL